MSEWMKKRKRKRKEGKLMSEGLNRKPQLIQIKHTLWANHSQHDLDKDSSSQCLLFFFFSTHSYLNRKQNNSTSPQ